MSLAYSIREGFAGFKRAKFATFISTVAMMLALVLLGVLAVVAYDVQQVINTLREQVGQFTVMLHEGAHEQPDALLARATRIAGVDSVQYVSPEDAQAAFQEEFGEGGAIFLEETFLPASLEIQVAAAYTHADSIAQIVTAFEGWSETDEVIINQETLLKVQENLGLVTLVGWAVGLLVVVVALFLVGNTIRLSIYARRLLIRTMKLVGATPAFIRRPFVVEGIVQGAIAGILAGGLLWLGYRIVSDMLPQLTYYGWPGGSQGIVLGGLVLVGVVLGWVASWFAAQRFIRVVKISG